MSGSGWTGEIRELEEEIRLEKYKQHWIEAVVDRLVARPGNESRLADSVETALRLAKGLVIVAPLSGEEQLYSENYACPNCGFSVEEMTPRMFSFNSPTAPARNVTAWGQRWRLIRKRSWISVNPFRTARSLPGAPTGIPGPSSI